MSSTTSLNSLDALDATTSTMPDPTIKGAVSDGISSAAEIRKDRAGYVTKKLRVLDMDVVEKIKNELKSVDANSDGR